MEKVDISVVIPAFNEADRIIPSLDKAWEYFASGGLSFELIIVDDGSRDSTKTEVERWIERRTSPSGYSPGLQPAGTGKAVIISHGRNKGKGAAVRTGIMASSGSLILFTDADLSTPIEEFEKLYGAIRDGNDISIASRGLPGSDISVPQPACRRLIGRIFPFLVRLLVLRDFRDTQCGFKLFKSAAARTLFSELETEGFAFDVEILFRAVKRKMKVKEVPVKWINSKASRVSILKDPPRMFSALCRIRGRIK